MIKFTIELQNKLGLHARASAKFVATASRFLSKIDVSHANQTINGKSIMAVMMLGAKCGSVLNFSLEGSDETELAAAMQTLINNKFGEED